MKSKTSPPSSSGRYGGRKPRDRRSAICWLGFDCLTLIRVLSRNRFQVLRQAPVDIVIPLAFASLIHTLLHCLELIRYGRKVSRTRITESPVFIIGHWRTGTTLLHELLGLDERHTYPTTYECFNPNHFLLTERMVGPLLSFLLPAHRSMDSMALGFDRPQEDEFALMILGLPSPYMGIVFPDRLGQDHDGYDPAQLSPRARERWKHTFVSFLRRITCARPLRLVLKSPLHTFRIKVLLELFPEARFVHIVRDPYVVFSSSLHTLRSMFRAFGLRAPPSLRQEDHIFKTFTRMHEKLEETRGLIPPGHFYELRYEDLIKDPTGEMRRLYQGLGLGGFESLLPRLKEYLAGVASYQPNRYELAPELRREISRRWGEVIKKYGYGGAGEEILR